MSDMHTLITVAAIWGLAAVTPGPNFFITVHTAVDTDKQTSLYTVLGIVCGTFVWSLCGFLGISILFKTAPLLYYSLKILGGLYLIFVGINLIFRNKNIQKNQKIKSRTPIDCFRLGLLTNLFNPKTAIFMTSLFAAAIPPSATLMYGALCVVIICSISAGWYALVASLFSHEMAKKSYEKQKGLIGRCAGAIFVGFGIKLATSK